MERKYRDKDWLRRQYVVKRKTQQEIAEECGVARSTISTWTRTFDLHRFQPPYFGTDVHGYEQIQCRIGGELHCVKVHRMIAIAEYGLNEIRGMDVHHKNNVPWDNRPENLEIVGHKEHGKISADKRWK